MFSYETGLGTQKICLGHVLGPDNSPRPCRPGELNLGYIGAIAC